MIKKIFYIFSKKEKLIFIKLIILQNIGILLEMLSIVIILPFLSLLLNKPTGLYFIDKYNININSNSTDNIIYFLIFLIIIIFLLKNVILYFLQLNQSKVLSKYNENLTNDIYIRYLAQPLKFLMLNNSSILSRNIIEVPTLFSHQFIQSFLNIIVETILVVLLILLLLAAQPFFTIFTFFLIIPIGVIIYKFNRTSLLKCGEDSKLHWGERLKQINQTFGGILEVKSFNRENIFFEKFKFHNKKLRKVSVKLSSINITPKFIFEFMIILIVCLIILFIFKIKYNFIDMLPLLSLFLYSFLRILPSINKILISFQRIKYSTSILNEIFFIKKNLTIDNNFSIRNLDFKYKIQVKNLDFEYSQSKKILSNLNLEFKKNTMIGIFGESGSGKSTFIKILLGLLYPTKGDILCDSTSIFEDTKSWQKLVSFVPQNIYLMDETLQYNLSLIENKKNVNQALLENVINQTNLTSFVENLPNKYETILGEMGQRISGGQKQRIGIARALYTNPKILILDESTSNLDSGTEDKILQELKTLTKSLTIIIVSHKEKIKSFCDQVFQIKNNSIN